MNTPGPGQLLFTFVRHWSRRATRGDALLSEQGRLMMTIEAVNSLTGRNIPASVNAIARELGIDQSGASRLVKNAVDAQYLEISRGAGDGRRRELTVTTAGHAILDQAHAWQEKVFAELTAGWSQQRRLDFRDAMSDLMGRSDAIEA